MAILLINSNDAINASNVQIRFSKDLNMTITTAVTARDIWARRDLPGTFTTGTLTISVNAKSSQFLLLKPSIAA